MDRTRIEEIINELDNISEKNYDNDFYSSNLHLY